MFINANILSLNVEQSMEFIKKSGNIVTSCQVFNF